MAHNQIFTLKKKKHNSKHDFAYNFHTTATISLALCLGLYTKKMFLLLPSDEYLFLFPYPGGAVSAFRFAKYFLKSNKSRATANQAMASCFRLKNAFGC